MQIIRENRPYEDFLAAREPVNCLDPRVAFVAEHLIGRVAAQLERMDQQGQPFIDPEALLVRLTYEYVRDKIADAVPETHSQLTFRASEVLNEKQGTDYGKANLLAALLRRNGIPTGFAYQYRRESQTGPLILHALNAVYLESLGVWIRLDATFQPATGQSPLELDPESLTPLYPDAWVRPVRPELGEDDLPVIYAEPDSQLPDLFSKAASLQDLWDRRPTRPGG
jgi:transglutaminase-like putative cysteine protease